MARARQPERFETPPSARGKIARSTSLWRWLALAIASVIVSPGCLIDYKDWPDAPSVGGRGNSTVDSSQTKIQGGFPGGGSGATVTDLGGSATTATGTSRGGAAGSAGTPSSASGGAASGAGGFNSATGMGGIAVPSNGGSAAPVVGGGTALAGAGSSIGGSGFGGTAAAGKGSGGSANGGAVSYGGAPRGTAGMTIGGAGGSQAGSAGVATCSDGVRQDSEQCDGSDLGGNTCASIGLGKNGSLGCTSQCLLDTNACAPILVLFGGSYSGYRYEVLGDTWEYSQKQWHSVASDGEGPRARSNAGMASVANGVLLFGGYDSYGYYDDTWIWNGQYWVEVTGLTSKPSARHGAAMARIRDQVILYGGWGNDGHLDDTWRWDGVAWTELHPEHRPNSSDGAAMANMGGSRLLLFGGKTGGTANDTYETFEWDPEQQDWLRFSGSVHPATPRWYAQAVPWRGSALLFGGVTSQATPNTLYADTWLWNGTSWSPPSIASGSSTPPARFYHAVGPTGTGVAIFGGYGASGLLADTWEYDGTKWVQNPAPTPSALGARMYVQFAAR